MPNCHCLCCLCHALPEDVLQGEQLRSINHSLLHGSASYDGFCGQAPDDLSTSSQQHIRRVCCHLQQKNTWAGSERWRCLVKEVNLLGRDWSLWHNIVSIACIRSAANTVKLAVLLLVGDGNVRRRLGKFEVQCFLFFIATNCYPSLLFYGLRIRLWPGHTSRFAQCCAASFGSHSLPSHAQHQPPGMA